MKLSNLLLLTIIISISFAFISPKSGSGEDGLLYWNPDYELQYKDFKAPPKKGRGTSNSHCSLGISMKFDKDAQENVIIQVLVHNIFSRSKSWMAQNDPTILGHERGHFDLSEVYARKLRSKISKMQLTYSNYNRLIREAQQETIQHLRTRRNNYTLQTNIGAKPEVQKQWEAIIQKEMNEYRQFKDEMVVVRIKS